MRYNIINQTCWFWQPVLLYNENNSFFFGQNPKRSEFSFGDIVRKIKLTQGYDTVVDDEDFERVAQFKWYAWVGRTSVYAVRHPGTGKENRPLVYLHREILVSRPGYEIDHVNRDTLDNRRCNLRYANRSQNNSNKGKQKNNTSGYKGVHWGKACKKWVAMIRHKHCRYYLGIFSDPIDAAKAYDVAARKYHGEFAKTNFEV